MSLEWKFRRPTFAGWFWLRHKAVRGTRSTTTYDPEVVEVCFDKGCGQVRRTNGETCELENYGDNYEWAGPLEIPR